MRSLISRLIHPFIATRRRCIVSGLIVLVVAVPALYLAWWLGSPLFIDEEIDEAFPLSSAAVIPAGMSQAEAESMMAAAAEIEQQVDEVRTSAMESAVAIKRGQFRDGDRFHSGTGSAAIYRLSDGAYVLRFEDFRVTNGPDLRVLISPHPDPESSGDATAEGYVELGELKGNVGPQNYFFPNGLEPDDFQSVIIYCKPFRVVFSVASLSNN